MPIAFAAVDPTISQLTARPKSLCQASRQLSSHPVPEASTLCSLPAASNSVSPGLGTLHAVMVCPAPTSTVAASAVNPAMVLETARPRPDPRRVVTPLSPDRAEELLCKYDLISDWSHVILGLREGFDIGIQEHLSRSYIFRQSFLLTVRSGLYIIVHSRRAGSRSLFGGLPPGGSRAADWSFSHIPSGASTKASYGYLPNDSRHVVSSERSRRHLCQSQHKCQ